MIIKHPISRKEFHGQLGWARISLPVKFEMEVIGYLYVSEFLDHHHCPEQRDTFKQITLARSVGSVNSGHTQHGGVLAYHLVPVVTVAFARRESVELNGILERHYVFGCES